MNYYRRFSRYLKEKFGARVHKIPLQAGFYCPNRDGRLSSKGCIFCDIYGSGPLTLNPPPIREQIKRGMERAARRYGARYFIAYFQAFTNTYQQWEVLERAYREALAFPEVVGLAIGTRPDCVPDEILKGIGKLAEEREVWLELGLESAHLRSLKFLNRNHGLAEFVDAVLRARKAGPVKICVHVIIGIPGEGRDEVVETARLLTALRIDGVKIHPLHVLRNTELERMYERGEVKLLSMQEYVSLAVDFLENLHPDIIICRLTGERDPSLFVAPDWCLRKQELLAAIDAEFERRGTAQGVHSSLGLSYEECRPLRNPVVIKENGGA